MPRLPFAINRDDALPLTEQIARGVRASIQAGVLKVGDRLPTILEMASELNVSPMIVRNAVRRLVESGELSARRKTGIRVAAAEGAARAHILYATWSGAVSYYFAARDHAFLTRLREGGFHVTVVYIDGREAAAGYPHMKRVLDIQPVSLAVISGGPFGADAFLAERGIRFVHAFPVSPSAGAMAVVDIDWKIPMRRLARHCASCGNRSVLAYVKLQAQPLKDAMTSFGIDMEVVDMDGLPRIADGCNPVEQSGFCEGRKLLAERPKLPDLIYSADDFFSRGLMMALVTEGVRIPQDIQFATQCNVGNIPVFARKPTRIEMDPQRDGLAMAGLAARAAVADRKSYSSVIRIPKFVAGGTTRRRS